MEFALVYVVDPHPLAPDLSPYSGTVWQLGFSKFRQARSFGERLQYANNVSTDGVFDVTLADGLEPAGTSTAHAAARVGNESNALWCAWGPAPNAAWLIASNRTVLLAQTWFDAPEIEAILGPLVSPEAAQPSA